MLVLACRYNDPDDAVRVGGAYGVRAVRRGPGGSVVLELTSPTGEVTARSLRVDETIEVGGLKVTALYVGPGRCKLGYVGPQSISVVRARNMRERQRPA